jgi:hypothetical protein
MQASGWLSCPQYLVLVFLAHSDGVTGPDNDYREVGIELRCASCRWRVTVLALSTARRVPIPAMATFPEAPDNPGQPVFPGPVRSLGHSFFLGPSQTQRGLSADSHTPRLRLVCPRLVPSPAQGLLPALCPATCGSMKRPDTLSSVAYKALFWTRALLSQPLACLFQ